MTPHARIVDAWSIPETIAQLPVAERLAALNEFSRPLLDEKEKLMPLPIGVLEELAVGVEFIFWMICLFAPPLSILLLPLAIWHHWPITLLLAIGTLYACVERISKDIWPIGGRLPAASRLLRYMSFRVIYEDPEFYHSGKAIYPLVPHGVFPAALFMLMLINARTPMSRISAAQASITFRFPYWRQFARMLGSIHASKRAIVAALHRGRSVVTFMDGIHGMFAAGGGRSSDEEHLFVEGKKGLVRIALLEGVPLVPCYAFGQTALVSNGQDPFGLLMWASRRLKISLLLPLGRFGLPIPHRVPLTLALGTPIPVEKVAAGTEPDPARVDELHAHLLRETRALFERHKARAGMPGRRLVVR